MIISITMVPFDLVDQADPEDTHNYSFDLKRRRVPVDLVIPESRVNRVVLVDPLFLYSRRRHLCHPYYI